MSKILIIPDVHGRAFWKYAKDHIDEFDKVVFLGDYLDPYPYEWISFDEAVNNFKEILEFKKSNLDKVELLMGNHCGHYIWLDFMNCSRLEYERRNEMNKLYCDNYKLFRSVYLHDKCLFSHAGVYEDWLNKYNLKLEDFLDKDISFWNGDKLHYLEDCSYHRGGRDKVGSLLWADIHESLTNHLLDGYYHIVGHTQLREFPYITTEIACLDVRRPFILDGNSITNVNGCKYKIIE